MAPDAERAAPVAEAARQHIDVGLLRLGGVELAVPVDWVREVVPCPAALGPCFGTHPALVGSIGVRGDVIPVVDLTVLLGFGAQPGQGGTIVVLRRDDVLLGLRIDSVSGLYRIPVSAVRELIDSGGEARLVDRAFVREAHLVGILEPATLFSMPGLPLVRCQARAEDHAALGRTRPFVLVTVAGVQIAIDSHLVESTAPAINLRRCAVPAPGWSRSVNYLGRDVRVFDQLATLGLDGATAEESQGPVILLRIAPDKLVGWHVESVRSVARISDDKFGPLPAGMVGRTSLFGGIVTDPGGGQNLLLDSEAVRADPAIRAMAALCRAAAASATQGAGNGQADGKGPPANAFLIFDTGARLLATPLDAIREVVPFRGLSSRVEDGSGLCGIGDHRGEAVSVYGIEPGMPAEDADLLIIAREQAGEGPRGYLARRLATIVNAPALPVPGGSPGARFVPARIDGAQHSIRIHMLG
ncbi:chemotaxis protein CheW [Sphingomonas sp. R1]|uniref:chemotaxis protein CheW n=1 Tax=Sphingomonas sp. R1 TaxID=399176 RepID=UPI0022242EB7|nr:chemotaxis protein CheW [Sphingomonas sp. R1]UYY78259.1 chemotaxis protein CheW [Sphingomonas sp. R1]